MGNVIGKQKIVLVRGTLRNCSKSYLVTHLVVLAAFIVLQQSIYCHHRVVYAIHMR